MFSFDDTIAAIASPPGGAARGIVRLSGPDAVSCATAVFRPAAACDLGSAVRATALAGTLTLPEFAAPLDGILYHWPAGRSYTGQAVVELHTLGSPPVLDAALETVLAAGSRLAEPGEFTLRAFLCRRIDLVQAEAVLGVIDARDAQQLDVALTQLAGGLAGPLTRLRDELLEMLARLEADLDFPDEDLPLLDSAELRRHLAAASKLIDGLLGQMQGRCDATIAARVVLVGAPNAGKSSLFNALAGRAAALTSAVPGTTRDYLTADLDLEGVRCRLVDTAGMESDRAALADVAQAAQDATHEQSRNADLRVLCCDASQDRAAPELPGGDEQAMLVLTKVDALAERPASPRAAIATSSVTGEGLEQLRHALRERLLGSRRLNLGVVPETAARCRQSLAHAAECLRRAGELLESGHAEELLAAELRIALSELGRVTGAVYTDDILDRIFSRFCIGK